VIPALAAILLIQSSAPSLRVEISTPKKRIWVCEPVKLTVRATATRPVTTDPIVDTAGNEAIQTWIDYGTGFVRYFDYSGGSEGVGGQRSLKAGERLATTVVLVNGEVGGQPTVPFPTAGRRTLRVVIRGASERDRGTPTVLGESNPIEVEVIAPSADGLRLLERIRQRPEILRVARGVDDAEFESLLTKFPGSPYLSWGRRAVMVDRIQRIANGLYPDSGERFSGVGRGPIAERLLRELGTELLHEDWGQFDEERLLLAAESMERGKARDDAQEVWAQLADRFPDSETAERARRSRKAR